MSSCSTLLSCNTAFSLTWQERHHAAVKSTKTGFPWFWAISRAALEKGCHCRRSMSPEFKGTAKAAMTAKLAAGRECSGHLRCPSKDGRTAMEYSFASSVP
jgi:hypothetical protein